MTVHDITDANLALWESIFATRSWGRYPPEELVRFVARTFRDPAARRTKRVLEVGCGPGANLWYLVREGFLVSGIDGAAQAIKLAHERLATEGLADEARPVDLRVGNFAKLPWPDESFDTVIDIEALSANIPPVIVQVISEISRVLKPGGYFFSKMFGANTTGIASGTMLDEQTTENPSEGPLAGIGVMHGFTEPEIRRLLSHFADLKLDSVERTDGNGAFRLFEWLVTARR